MANERYVRWQGLGIGQLTVAIAFISGGSIAALGGGLSLLKDKDFLLPDGWKCVFAISQLLLILAVTSSGAAVVTRLLDFRLTARKVRKDNDSKYDKSLTLFGCDKDEFSLWTWRFFWSSCVCFALGMTLLIVSLAVKFGDKLH
jgi:hypothetical protein